MSNLVLTTSAAARASSLAARMIHILDEAKAIRTLQTEGLVTFSELDKAYLPQTGVETYEFLEKFVEAITEFDSNIRLSAYRARGLTTG